ncbi:MAG: PEP-CTERM sorting domain-containing protein [Candidatus Sulfotelmatobacter sp.]
MKFFLIMFGILALAMPAAADSINFNGTGSTASAQLIGIGSNIQGSNIQTSSSGVFTDMQFAATNCCGAALDSFSSGTLSDIVEKGSTFFMVYGSLTSGLFNSKTGLFTASFSGAESYYNGTSWSFNNFTGTFTEHVYLAGANSGGISFGNLGNGSLTNLPQGSVTAVPEPGSLFLMGTGLIAMGGLVRRKAQGASLNYRN